MSIINIERRAILIVLLFFSYQGTKCDVYTESDNENKELKIVGNVLETYNLNKGIEKSTSVLNKNVEINLNDKYTIQAGRLEEKIINGNKYVYFTGNPKIKTNEATISSKVFIFDIKKKVLTLKSNVSGQYQDYNISTDLCTFELENNIVSFDNYAKIKKKDISIESKNGIVDINKNTVELTKNVKIKNKNYILECNRVFTNSETTTCYDNIVITDEKNIFSIYTKNNVVFTNENKIIMMSNAIIYHSDFLCFGQDIRFNTETEKIYIENAVEILTRDNYRITCNNLEFDYNRKKGILTDNIMIEITNENKKDENIYITTDLIEFKIIKPVNNFIPLDELDMFSLYAYKNTEYFENKNYKNKSKIDDKLNVVAKKQENLKNYNVSGTQLRGSSISFEAIGNVEVISQNIKCKSDSFIYENSQIIFNNPIDIWQNENRIISNYAVMYINNGIEKVVLKDDPYIIFYQDGYPNQVKCKEIYIGLINNSIDKILFYKDVDSILFISDNKELKYINNLKTNKLCIIFDRQIGNPINALFNQNSGKIITIKEVDKNKNILFMDRYNDTLKREAPNFNKISRNLNKMSNIPTTHKLRFFRNE